MSEQYAGSLDTQPSLNNQIYEQEPGDVSALEKYDFVPLARFVNIHELMVQLDQIKNFGSGNYFGFGFHSISKEGRDEKLIQEIDLKAYSEVEGTDGFYAYIPGQRDESTRKCVSICVWDSLETAGMTLKNSKTHALAVQLAKEFYDVGVVEYLDIEYSEQGSRVSHVMPAQELRL